jgi:hypothetical protein
MGQVHVGVEFQPERMVYGLFRCGARIRQFTVSGAHTPAYFTTTYFIAGVSGAHTPAYFTTRLLPRVGTVRGTRLERTPLLRPWDAMQDPECVLRAVSKIKTFLLPLIKLRLFPILFISDASEKSSGFKR